LFHINVGGYHHDVVERDGNNVWIRCGLYIGLMEAAPEYNRTTTCLECLSV
jgi:hypothetical protein